jgi:hypothetical protein
MRFPRLSTVGWLVLLLASPWALAPAWAACSDASLSGTFGYFHGRPDGIAGMRAIVGQMMADGRGNLSGSWTMSLNGTISTGNFTGSYSIAKDCTGSITLLDEDFPTADYNVILDDGHRGFQILQTDSAYSFKQGWGVSCRAKPANI